MQEDIQKKLSGHKVWNISSVSLCLIPTHPTRMIVGLQKLYLWVYIPDYLSLETSLFYLLMSYVYLYNRNYATVVVQSPSCVQFFMISWTAVRQTSLSLTISQRFPKFMSIELAMLYNHLILCHPLFLLPSVFPSIRVFSNEPAVHNRSPKYKIATVTWLFL